MTRQEAVKRVLWALRRMDSFGSQNHDSARDGSQCRKQDPEAYYRSAWRRIRLPGTCGFDVKRKKAWEALCVLIGPSGREGVGT